MVLSLNTNYVKWFGGLLAMIILQTTILQYVSIDITADIRINPDLVLLVLFFFGLKNEQVKSTIAGFAAGLILDILSGGIIGLNAFVKTIVGFSTGYLPRIYKIKQLWKCCLLLFIICMIHDVIYNLIYAINTGSGFWRIFIYYSLPSSLYTVFIGGLVFYWNNK